VTDPFGPLDVQVGGRVVMQGASPFGAPMGPDGKVERPPVVLTEIGSGRALPAVTFPEGRPNLPYLSPTGDRVLTESFTLLEAKGAPGVTGMVRERWIQRWLLADPITGREVARSEGESGGTRWGFSPDGRYLLVPAPARASDSAGTQSVEIRDARSGKLITTAATWPADRIGRGFLFDPKGRLLLFSHREWPAHDANPREDVFRVQCVNPADGRELWSKTVSGPFPQSWSVWGDGQRVATNLTATALTGADTLEVQILDAATGSEQHRIVLPSDLRGTQTGILMVNDVAFSPDGTRIGIASGREVLVYELGTNRPPVRFVGHDREVQAVRFDADSRRICALERRHFGGPGSLVIKIWDIASARELLTLQVPEDDNREPMLIQSPETFGFTGGKLRLLMRDGIREYDGTPVGP
jgi:WD40 repeat protein